MLKKNIKIIIISLWSGMLALPFTGIKDALYLCGSIFTLSLLIIPIKKINFKKDLLHNQFKKISLWTDSKKNQILIALFSILFFLTLPVFLNNYFIDVLTLSGIYIILALGLNIVVGLAGLLNLGFVAFYAIGAYFYAILSTQMNFSFWTVLPIGIILTATTGVLLSFPALRLKGDYLAIVTLGFGEIIHLVLNNWDKVTKGPNGIMNISAPKIGAFVFNSPIHYYYLIFIFVIIAIFIIIRINNSKIGRYWVAIREDEIAAETLGIDTIKMKLLAFSFGASFAGLAGALFAAKMRFVSPESFTFFESIIILCMVILGGMGSVFGVILGALFLIILPEVLREFALYRMLALGAGLVVMMIFRPEGILGGPRRRAELKPEDEQILKQEQQA